MPDIDLAAFFPDALRLKDHTGRVWVIQPPTKRNGLIMAALNAQGAAMASQGGTCEACGQVVKGGLSPAFTQALEDAKDVPIEVVAFGQATYEAMIEADVPGPVMERMALYTVWYWSIGKEYADAMIGALSRSRDPEKRPEGAAAGKARSASRGRSKSGHRSASVNPTSTASTSGTAPQPA